MQIGAMNGSDWPRKCGRPRLMKMASSMTAMSRNGSEMLRSTSRMMRKIARIDTALTTLKSWSVVSIMSFMHGASPMSIPVGSYFFRMALSESIWAFTSSLATLYSELMSSSSHLSLLRIERTESGRISSGTPAPTTDSRPRTYFTPSTCSISEIMLRTCFDGRDASTSSMCVEAISNSSESLLFAITYSMSSGRHWPMS